MVEDYGLWEVETSHVMLVVEFRLGDLTVVGSLYSFKVEEKDYDGQETFDLLLPASYHLHFVI